MRQRRTPKIKDGTYYMYLRKSRKDIEREKWGEGETLARHEADLDDVCARDGYPIEEKFKEVVSGESISERKEFQKLMKLVEERKVTGLIVHAVDRLGRGSIDEYGWVIATLQRTRTLVITPGKVYDPTDQADYMALVMHMIISAGELAAQKERYRDGKNRSAKMGEFIGSHPPYGYDKVVVDRYKTLKPNDKADVVRMIFRRVANHDLTGVIAREMNEAGIRSDKGKTWRPVVLKRIVRNVVYKGEIAWGMTRVEVVGKDGFKDKKVQTWQDADDVIISPGLHEPIVSEELWQAANDALSESPRTPKASKLRNPLAGMLRCGKCGYAVTYRSTDRNRRAKTNRYRHRAYLDCEGWLDCNADAILVMVVDSLMDLADDMELKIEAGADAEARREEELAALRSELAAAERQAERLIDLYTEEHPAISIEAFRRRNTVLQEQINTLNESIAKVEAAEVPDYKVLALSIRETAEILKDPKRDAEHKNAMLKQVIDRIDMVNHGTVRGKDDIELHIFLRNVGNINQ
jgi:DNA invertase Pin-like site-specific DNA recombinase